MIFYKLLRIFISYRRRTITIHITYYQYSLPANTTVESFPFSSWGAHCAKSVQRAGKVVPWNIRGNNEEYKWRCKNETRWCKTKNLSTNCMLHRKNNEIFRSKYESVVQTFCNHVFTRYFKKRLEHFRLYMLWLGFYFFN